MDRKTVVKKSPANNLLYEERKIMKKILFLEVVMLVGILALSACSTREDSDNGRSGMGFGEYNSEPISSTILGTENSAGELTPDNTGEESNTVSGQETSDFKTNTEWSIPDGEAGAAGNGADSEAGAAGNGADSGAGTAGNRADGETGTAGNGADGEAGTAGNIADHATNAVGSEAEKEGSDDSELMAVINRSKIEEQSFEVLLNDWGKVTFVSCMRDGYNKELDPLTDVSFYLLDGDHILYRFPDVSENNVRTVGFCEGVSFVSFEDINGDDKKEIIIGALYVTGAGPQGMIPYPEVRIYEDQGNEFVYNKDLCDKANDYLSLGVSIEDVMTYIRDYSD